jgi:translation initiation factor 1 (eIF-1/SUI1)
MSNPFEEMNNNSIITKNSNIEVWVEANGRKKNTYISGWELTNEQLKEHIKTIKKKNGCNGTIKDIINEDTAGITQVIQLQGDHVDFVVNYLKQNNVDPSAIIIKG